MEGDSPHLVFCTPFLHLPAHNGAGRRRLLRLGPVRREAPTCLKGLGEKGLAVSGGGASSSNHKYKFYSRSLSPFVFLGGLRALSAPCMSNSGTAPPGWMMDGSERREQARAHAGLPCPILKPHRPQVLPPFSFLLPPPLPSVR